MPEKRAAKRAASRAGRRLLPAQVGELQRAYEHLGRIEILEGALTGSAFVDVSALNSLAQQQLMDGFAHNAAGLLHAAEHICFAALAPNRATVTLVSSELKGTLATEFEDLMRRAEERWNEGDPARHTAIQEIFGQVMAQARSAFDRADYRPALELARAAQALSNLGEGMPASLPKKDQLGRLAS